MKQLIQKVLLDMIFKMYLIGYNYSEAVNSESSIRHDIQDVLNWIITVKQLIQKVLLEASVNWI